MTKSCCPLCSKEVNDEFIGRCGHKFHAVCIKIKFIGRRDNTCPTCKTKLLENKNIEVILYKACEQDSPNYKDLVAFFEEIERDSNLIIITKQIVEEAINLGLDLNNTNSTIKDLLNYVVRNSLVSKLNMLMDLGLKLNPCEALGKYVWETALKYESFSILERMKDLGFDPKSVDISSSKSVRVTMWAIKNGLEVERKVRYLHLIHKACELMDINIIKTAIFNGADINCKDVNGQSPLHIYVENVQIRTENLHFMQELINLGAEIDSVDSKNETPLYIALKRKHMIIVNFLLSKGANLDTPKIKELGSILFYSLDCCSKCNFSVFREFLQYLPDIKEIDHNGQTCLHKVMGNFDFDYVKLFVELGADVNAQDFQGNTPLHVLSSYSIINRRKLQYLLENGADIYLENNDGKNIVKSFR